MKGASFRTKIRETVEKQTIDKFINTEHQTEEQFISDLWNIGESDALIDALKKKLETEQQLYKEGEEREEEVFEEDEESKTMEKVFAKPVVNADEIKPELVEYIKGELMEKMQVERSSVITEFVQHTAVTQEEFYKLQLWSFFPILGIPVYFFFLMALSINGQNKYTVSIQNYAKAQLRTFWIYLVAHASVVFVSAASITSLINIIQRGLAA